MSSKPDGTPAGDSRGGAQGKRKKTYYKAQHGGGGNGWAKRQKRCLGPGMRGFIISYPRGREQAALHDSLTLLGEYADRLYGAAASVGDSDGDGDDRHGISSEAEEEDIVAALERESSALRSSGGRGVDGRQQQRFSSVDSGVNQLLFISTPLDSPVQLVETVLEDVASKKASPQASRNVLRLLPVELTCKADHDKMEAAVEQAAKSFFGSRQPEEGAFSYSIMYKSRNNGSSAMHRDVVIPKMASVLHRCYPCCKVDLTNPDFFLFIEVLKTVCCISIVTKYFQYKKFNLQELCIASLGIARDSCGGAAKRDGDEGANADTGAASAAELASDHSNVVPAPKGDVGDVAPAPEAGI